MTSNAGRNQQRKLTTADIRMTDNGPVAHRAETETGSDNVANETGTVAGFEGENAADKLFAETQPIDEQSIELEPLEADTLSDIAYRLNAKHDQARINAGCSLLNTFNYAIQVQANREQWSPADYRAFIIALSAMDRIGIEAHEDAKASHASGA